jgi:mannose-6-phosphate isomerase-like protein (cupin superfamily)
VLIVAPAPAADSSGSSATATRDEWGEVQPLKAPGQTLYLQRVTIPPGQQLVDHFHEGTQIAHIVKGVLTYDVISGTVQITRRDGSTESVEGPKTVKLRAGESLVEVESLAHAGANAGTRPVVIDVAALLATGAPLATPLGSAAEGTPLTLTADLTSAMTQLTTVGPDASATYGWNRLTGTATDATGPVQVEMLGNVAYREGAGPFFGFVTFTFSDGSVLGTQMQGVATKDANGITQFASTLGVIDGTGRYLGATGSGTFTGSRDAALGQPVDATFDLTLRAAQ